MLLLSELTLFQSSTGNTKASIHVSLGVASAAQVHTDKGVHASHVNRRSLKAELLLASVFLTAHLAVPVLFRELKSRRLYSI